MLTVHLSCKVFIDSCLGGVVGQTRTRWGPRARNPSYRPVVSDLQLSRLFWGWRANLFCTVYERHHGLCDYSLKNRIEGRHSWEGSKGEKRWLKRLLRIPYGELTTLKCVMAETVYVTTWFSYLNLGTGKPGKKKANTDAKGHTGGLSYQVPSAEWENWGSYAVGGQAGSTKWESQSQASGSTLRRTKSSDLSTTLRPPLDGPWSQDCLSK